LSLDDAIPILSLITKRFFIGDEQGLGKTVMSAACYANYAYHMLKRGKEPTKVLVVTTSSHVNSWLLLKLSLALFLFLTYDMRNLHNMLHSLLFYLNPAHHL